MPATAGKAEFTATIYNADKAVIKNIVNSVNVIDLPTIITLGVSDKSQNGAVLGGNVTSDGYTTVTERGVCYSTTSSPSPTIFNNKKVIGSGTGRFSDTVLGLTEGTTYYFRAYAINKLGPAYGDTVSFNTLGTAPEKPVVQRWYFNSPGNGQFNMVKINNNGILLV